VSLAARSGLKNSTSGFNRALSSEGADSNEPSTPGRMSALTRNLDAVGRSRVAVLISEKIGRDGIPRGADLRTRVYSNFSLLITYSCYSSPMPIASTVTKHLSGRLAVAVG
jgi:hypothetical protein